MTGLISGTDFGVASSQSQITVSAVSHPLSTGVSTGKISVYLSVDNLNWGVPSKEAIIITTLADDLNKATFYAYEKGSNMVGYVAPGRRVGFYSNDKSATLYTEDGTKLFENVVCWIAGKCGTTTGNNDILPNFLKIFPNPTSGKLKIQNNESQIKQICLYSTSGLKLITTKTTESIDLSIYPDGIYIIEIECISKLYRQLVIKTKS
jgi:hypothetical protein